MKCEAFKMFLKQGFEEEYAKRHAAIWPELGISIYHKQQDLIDIPTCIKAIVPEYRFYFRVHKKLAIDTVLYGVV